ncbi:glucosamine-6-phosphate deaminase [Vibrio natriegens]|uniref:glucosamine-6-phosphate deaminase n=1 Tax=Vibrio natriegens TaxID=691 RepID=UPI001EFCEF73|nr:glucosamine-6-phosphate deaminase [Vibrio natriegens]MCG9700699.1 glucosamine-6-phosphate deaminase [Vibrio natriegens]
MKTEQNTHVSPEVLSLLGAALIAIQKVECALYSSIQPLCKQSRCKNIQALGNMTSNQFLKGTTTEIQPTLLSLQHELTDNLPMPIKEISQFIYKRNLITHHFWQLTDAQIKGTEKLSQPVLFLKNLLDQCDEWLKQIKNESLKSA